MAFPSGTLDAPFTSSPPSDTKTDQPAGPAAMAEQVPPIPTHSDQELCPAHVFQTEWEWRQCVSTEHLLRTVVQRAWPAIPNENKKLCLEQDKVGGYQAYFLIANCLNLREPIKYGAALKSVLFSGMPPKQN